MSFQDLGKKKKKAAAPAAPAAVVSPVRTSNNPLGQTSENLLQYQRNVGMLESIVQSLLARPHSRNSELDAQYNAQMDVIRQLGSKLQQQVAVGKTEATEKSVWIKLERDLEKIQARVGTLEDSVQRIRARQAEQQQTLDDLAASAGGPDQAVDDYEFQQQMQMQQDRMNEEIMREREEEIRNINRGMHQVNEIYKDLAHIVGSQQEQIDSIETQMEDARTNAENGLQQVEQANDKFGNSNCVIS